MINLPRIELHYLYLGGKYEDKIKPFWHLIGVQIGVGFIFFYLFSYKNMPENKKSKPELTELVNSLTISYRPKMAFAFQSINSALFLEAADLISRQLEEYGDGKWAPTTVRDVYELTNLTRFQQKIAIEKLKTLEIIETKLSNIPARRFIKINYERLSEQIHLADISCIRYPNGYRKIINKLK